MKYERFGKNTWGIFDGKKRISITFDCLNNDGGIELQVPKGISISEMARTVANCFSKKSPFKDYKNISFTFNGIPVIVTKKTAHTDVIVGMYQTGIEKLNRKL